MRKLRDLTWDEVFAGWREREAGSPGWIETATTIKGWPDWESWRMFTARQLGLPDREWAEYALTDPASDIPSFFVGPYSGWQSRCPKPNATTFAELVAIPAQEKEWSSRPDIVRMGHAFPSPTTLIGLRKPDGRIVLIEGHHRAVAAALAARQQRSTVFGDVTIVLAETRKDEAGLFDRVLARGSSFRPSV